MKKSEWGAFTALFMASVSWLGRFEKEHWRAGAAIAIAMQTRPVAILRPT